MLLRMSSTEIGRKPVLPLFKRKIGSDKSKTTDLFNFDVRDIEINHEKHVNLSLLGRL